MSRPSRLLRHSVSLALCLGAGSLQAAGFALIEQSAQGLGNAYSGATVSDDLSVAYFNPAALTRMDGEAMSVAAHIITPSVSFTNNGSFIPTSPTTVAPIAGSNGGDAGGENAVPNFYYTKPVNEDMHFGLAINVPYGLSTSYSSDWVGRYHAVSSAVETLNVNPSLSWKVNDKLAIGFGANIQYIKAELTSHIDAFGACVNFVAGSDTTQIPTASATCGTAGLAPASVAGAEAQDSYTKVKGNDTSVGFNFGLLYTVSDATDIGFAVRTKIKHTLDGSADFTLNQALLDPAGAGAVRAAAEYGGLPLMRLVPMALADQTATASIDLPAQLSASLAQKISSDMTFFADFTWTGWSSVEELRVKFDGSLAGQDDVSTLAWEDTSRISVGLDYAMSDTVTLRAGLASDESPVPNAQRRTARIPDSDRTWVAFGASFATSPQASVDIGYALVEFDDSTINNTKENGSGYTLNGSYSGSVDIISAQYSYNF